MPLFLVTGNDKISDNAISNLNQCTKEIVIIRDISTSYKRIYKLISKKRLSLSLLLKMYMCEIKRKKKLLNEQNSNFINLKIKSNNELINLIDQYQPEKVVLFRAGLIINKSVISTNVPILNIHCAKIPEYGGLGSINRAIEDQCHNQCATLHQVTTNIDSGIIYDTEPYILDAKKSYCYNEDIAYSAGIRLLKRTFGLA